MTILMIKQQREGNVPRESTSESDLIRIFDISFIIGGYKKAIELLKPGAFMVVPAAPALVMIQKDTEYQQAMLGSDFAIADSGFMVLLLRLLKGVRITKFSGLEFLRAFLQEEMLRQPGSLFLIDPSEVEKAANNAYLRSLGILLEDSDHYVAPMYGKGGIQDAGLLARLHVKRPRFIMINLGGGVQEKLGYYLKTHLDYRPGIICTGAAIAFLTGKQASIPEFADRLYLGWLMRCLSRPSVYVPRYLGALRLIPMVWKADV